MRKISRREFLQQSALSTALFSFGALIAKVQQVEPVRIGVIGTGAQGQNLLRQLVAIPGAEVVALCDIYPPHLQKGVQLVGSEVKSYTDYRALLEDKAVQAVVIATPLYLHAPMTLDALKAGKHVFCEKMMAYTLDQAKAMARAARETKRVLQIGHQRRYNPLYHEALKRLQEGLIGRVTHIRALWHRNGSWRRPLPDPQDTKLERLLNWRLYKAYSRGLMAELGSHQIDVVNWFLGATPLSVCGYGGIDYWKDGREVFDNVNLLFEYPNGVKLIYTSITTNAYDGYGEWFFGDKGTLVLTNENKGLLFREPAAEKLDWIDAAHREKLGDREAIVVQSGPTKRVGEPGKTLEYGPHRNAYYLELEHFLRCVREGEKPLCPPEEALKACAVSLLANEAMEKGSRPKFKPEMFEVES